MLLCEHYINLLSSGRIVLLRGSYEISWSSILYPGQVLLWMVSNCALETYSLCLPLIMEIVNMMEALVKDWLSQQQLAGAPTTFHGPRVIHLSTHPNSSIKAWSPLHQMTSEWILFQFRKWVSVSMAPPHILHFDRQEIRKWAIQRWLLILPSWS